MEDRRKIFLTFARVFLPGVKFTTLVYKLATAKAFHTEWRHKTDSLLFGSRGLRTLVAHDLGRIEIRGVAKGEDWLTNAITSKAAFRGRRTYYFCSTLRSDMLALGEWLCRLFRETPELARGGRWR